MSAPDIRSHLGTSTLALMSQRDWPEGLVQTGREENETWLYLDGHPVRKLGIVEAWNLLNPERPICPTC